MSSLNGIFLAIFYFPFLFFTFFQLDMEKALVTAELSSESTSLIEMERNLITLQNKIHRLETQRNANRVMQETQQAKLRQNIDGKRDQIGR
jgi:uncharacterized small protein (DUF1192 family)